jgi:hypothetical protein
MRRALLAMRPMTIVAASAAAWIACGGQEQGTPPYSGPPEDAPTLSLDDYCAQYLQVACDAISRCCTDVPIPSNCGAYASTFCDDLRLHHSTGTAYDPVAGAVCVASMRQATSACNALYGGDAFGTLACSMIFNEGVAPGGACTSLRSCAYVRHAMTSCEGGVCVARPIVGAGAPCADAVCDLDLVCATTCVPAPTAGEACTSTCRHDLYCDTTSHTSHTCAPPLSDGASCTTSFSCASHSCSGGKCASVASTCTF